METTAAALASPRHHEIGTKVRRKAHASESPPRTTTTRQVEDKNGRNPVGSSATKQRRRPSGGSLIPPLLFTNNNEPVRKELSRNVLMGLTVAGLAQALLRTIFRLFHVDVFLQAYHLPLESYSNGSFAVSVITTITSVVGSWMVDTTATKRDRTESVGQTGFYFVACFLTPFYGFHPQWGTIHFILTVSLYQTLYSYTAILLGSIVTDSHTMTQQQRVAFMASGKAVNLVLTFVVGRIALMTFQENNLHSFRLFLVVLAGVTLFLFALADSMIRGTFLWRSLKSLQRLAVVKTVVAIFIRSDKSSDKAISNANDGDLSTSSAYSDRPKKRLRWRRIVADFVKHHNFRVWVVMEMLLHAQITFNANFLKTFVDFLLVEEFGRDTSDWLLSLVGPMTQFVTIVAYIPIQRWGYSRVYFLLFVSNFLLSNMLLWFVGPTSGYGICAFLMVYSISTRAVQSAGFHLAMADMVLEMKRKHARDRRYDEPSVAGLFMGANALLCVRTHSMPPGYYSCRALRLTYLLLPTLRNRNLLNQCFP